MGRGPDTLLPSDTQRLSFEATFDGERLRSEVLRAGWLCLLFLFAGVIMGVIGTVFLRRGIVPIEEARIMFLTGPLFALYEGTLWFWLRRHLERGTRPGAWFRPGNVTVEMTAVTVHILAIAGAGSTQTAISGPPTMVYIGFMFLATLALDWRLPVYGGFLAALQYLAAALWIKATLPADVAATPVYAPDVYLPRAVFLALAGIAAAAVAWEVKKRVLSTLAEIQERKRVLDLFGQQVSPEVADKLLEQASAGGLTSEMRSVCVMFLDIRGFTQFSELRSPEEVVRYLNTLFDSMIDAVNRNGGIINKFLGDGFMAVFGAPVSDGQDSYNGVRAARELLYGVESMVERGDIPPTRIGIGLHTGEAVTGNVGSHRRREYTVIGDVVNTAARIEALNKEFGSQILVSAAVVEAASEHEDVASVELERVTIRGRSEPMVLHRVA